jgi:beta-phosphoglucomutase
MKFPALFFDFDGVLVDSEPLHHAAWQQVLDEFRFVLSWEDYERNCIGVSDRAMIQSLVDLSQGALPFDPIWQRYADKKRIFRQMMFERPPLTQATQDMLHAAGQRLPLALVTSSESAELTDFLQMTGLDQHFQASVFGDDVQERKPSPEPYLLAAQRMGVSRALVVEDSAAGEASARAAGHEVMRVRNAAEAVEKVNAWLALPL